MAFRSGPDSENPDPVSVVSISLNPTTDRVIELPRLVPGDHIQGKVLARYPAGKAVNLSRALAILGHESFLTGFIGREEDHYYRTTLESNSDGLIRCDFVPVESRTRENITLIDLESNLETHIRENTFFVTGDEISSLLERLGKADFQDRIVCLAGSLPRGFGEGALHDLIDLLITRGAKVAVDSSGSHLRSLRKKKLWLIKPNRTELEQLTDTPIASERDILSVLPGLSADFEFVLASAGDKGAFLLRGKEAWHGFLQLRREEVKSTVGCGDCLLAGFLAGLARDLESPEALRFGLASGAANATFKTTADYSREDVLRLLPETRVAALQLG